MNVFNLNNQDLNNMVWMNNNANNGGFATTTPGMTTNMPPVLIDENNSVTYYNTQPSAGVPIDEISQQTTAMMEMSPQLQGTNFIGDFTTNPTGIPAELLALQQQQLQLQQLNLAYGNFVNQNLGNQIMASAEDDENEIEDDEEVIDESQAELYDENSSTSDINLQQHQQQQQQIFFLPPQQAQPPQQLLEQSNMQQISDYFLINNPHLYNSGSSDEAGTPNQRPQIPQQLLIPSKSATQTLVNKKPRESSKILPVRRPGLKLKTPIAYFGNTDPSVIPIQKDGMGVCEKCGAIGVKHAFYTKERRFCSLSCARGFEEIAADLRKMDQNQKNKKINPPSYKFKSESGESEEDQEKEQLFETVLPQEPVPQIIRKDLPQHYTIEDRTQSIRRKPTEFMNSYDWIQQIDRDDFYAAPVTNFPHAPGYDVWPDIDVGMKVEVENTDFKDHPDHHGHQNPFWIATVLKIHGYKAKLRYEGFEADASHDFWVNLCTTEVHPVGWCASQGRPIIPPLKVEARIKNIKKYLLKTLHHAKTLPGTFYNKLFESFRSRFETNLVLEVVDKNCISQVKLARIQKIVGKRLYVQYYDTNTEDGGFWCHEDSPLIHPVGWATTVGHKLSAPPEYIERMNVAREQILDPNDDDATMDLFKLNFLYEDYFLDDKETGFRAGMKLEAIDPLNLSSICVATVMEVLKFGYIMIRIDSYDPDGNGNDWFCYHEKSPCIFPVGFCKAHGIPLTPPNGYSVSIFNWSQYLRDTKAQPATEKIFHKFPIKHGFKPGMKIECADLMDPRLVCVATISKVVGRLLRIHFDGWEDEYDQWLDCDSPDIYPVGWCVTVGHKLEGPRELPKSKPTILFKKVSPKSKQNVPKQKGPKRKNDVKKMQQQIPTTKYGPLPTCSSSISAPNTIPITYIKRDLDDDTYSSTVKFVNTPLQPQQHYSTITQHQQQQTTNLATAPTIKIETECNSIIRDSSSSSNSNSSSFNNINHFKILQRNLDRIEQQHMIGRQKQQQQQQQQQMQQQQQQGQYQEEENEQQDDEDHDDDNVYIEGHDEMHEPPSQLLDDDDDDDDITLSPLEWDCNDVIDFLTKNNCEQYCELFLKHKVDGKKLLLFSQNDIIQLLGMKVGPAIKIYDLIQQLKPATGLGFINVGNNQGQVTTSATQAVVATTTTTTANQSRIKNV